MTITKIAKLVGCSPSTVSLALRKDKKVSASMTSRVSSVAEAMNYTPDMVARSMITKRTNTIGLLIPYFGQIAFSEHIQYFGELIQYVESAARASSLDVIVTSTGDDTALAKRAIQMMRSRRVDAILVWTSRAAKNTELILDLVKSGIVVVAVSYQCELPLNCVALDRRKGGAVATRHLIGLGHRRIAYLNVSPNPATDLKLQGYVDALEHAGIELDKDIIIEWDKSWKNAYDLAEKVLNANVTAAFAASDQLAIGMIHGLRAKGARVPEDIAIVGFGDGDMAAYAEVPLTTVREPLKVIAERAVEIVVEKLSARGGQKESCTQELVEPRLVIRQSCGAGAREEVSVGAGEKLNVRHSLTGGRVLPRKEVESDSITS